MSRDLRSDDIENFYHLSFTSVADKVAKTVSSLTVVDVGMNRWNPQIFPENFDLFVADPGAHFVFTVLFFQVVRYKRTTIVL